MKAHLIEVLLILGLAVIGIVDGLAPDKSVTFQRESLPPGLYVVLVSVVLLVFGAAYLRAGWKREGTESSENAVKSRAGLWMWAAMVGYAAVVPLLGYSISTFVFFAAVFLLLGVRPLWRSGMLALVFAAAFYLAFVRLANVWLPSGWVGHLLGMSF